jgi:hypothetical protein
LYNPLTQKLSEPNPIRVLNKIACEENTPTAHVDYEEVEALTNTAIESWCYKHQVSLDEVERICSLYLKPEKEKDDLTELLAN